MSKVGKECVAESTEGVKGAFLGRHDYSLDPKKRLTIPSEWREALGSVVYVIPDRREKCLNLYSKSEMEVLLGQLRQKAFFDPALDKVCAAIGAVSQQLALDVQGRIRIADRLLRFANLTTTVAMVGSVSKIKLYDPTALAPEDTVDVAAFDAALREMGL